MAEVATYSTSPEVRENLRFLSQHLDRSSSYLIRHLINVETQRVKRELHKAKNKVGNDQQELR
jgi:predicted DNA-binding protein